MKGKYKPCSLEKSVMFRRMKLQTRLICFGIGLTLLPMLAASGIVLVQNRQMMTVAREETEILAMADLDHLCQSAYDLCRTQSDVISQNIESCLKVAHDIMSREGTAYLSDEKVAWTAINQFSQQNQKMELPKMMLGETWLGNNSSLQTVSPVVDKVRHLVGGTCTIFQRMNDSAICFVSAQTFRSQTTPVQSERLFPKFNRMGTQSGS
jgi:hypothetical protein